MPIENLTPMERREEAEALLVVMASIQRNTPVNCDCIPCPRCGHYTMAADLYMNESSVNFDGHVCRACGEVEEREERGEQVKLEIEDWAFPLAYAKENGEELTEADYVAEEEGFNG